MESPQTFWSRQALQDFSALFEDGSSSDAFRHAVAEALAKGWGGNKDKPFWAMAWLVAATGAALSCEPDTSKENTPHRNEQENTKRKETLTGLELIWKSPAQLLEIFAARLAHGPLTFPSGRLSQTQNGIIVQTDQGDLKFGRIRIGILKKVSEFLLACDEFAYADEVMQILARLAQGGLENVQQIREEGRALSRLAYKYRTLHFKDGHAASGFSLIKAYLAKHNDFSINDNTLFDFWTWPQNTHYKTYGKVFHAFADFSASLAEARIIASATSPLDVENPVVQNELHHHSAAVSGDIEGETGPALLEIADALRETPLKIFKQKEIRLVADLCQAGKFGIFYPHSLFRLLSFHIVQSGISNSLRTGRSKLPLEERVQCFEAIPYAQLNREIEMLQHKFSDWLKVCLYMRQGGKGNTSPNDSRAVISEGALVFKRARLKSLEGDRQEIAKHFAELESAIIAGAYRLQHVLESIEKHFGPLSTTDQEKIRKTFETDQKLFSREFKKRYLPQSPVTPVTQNKKSQ